MDAPVHRLLALVDQALLDEARERPRDGRLIPEIHGQVRAVPCAEHAEALELLGHVPDEPLRVLATCPTEFGDRTVALFRTELVIDLQLDRQALAVGADE